MTYQISGKTKIACLIGWPVSHSFSPAMHNAAFQDANLDYVYICFPVKPERIPEAISGFRALDICGANVTIPHKEAVVPFLDEVSDEARKIGAVNTILNHEGSLAGFNTDVYGYSKSLELHDFDMIGVHAVIIGAGGVARAIAIGHAMTNAASITITDTAAGKAGALVSNLRELYPSLEVRDASRDPGLLIKSLVRADIVINATPLGMKETDPLFLDSNQMECISPSAAIFDAIYNVKETKLEKTCRARHIKYVGGLDMLLYQGVRAFEIWTEQTPNIPLMKKVLQEKLGTC
ncbi:shikimate dehydrogenase [Candidatus Sumerlaeota bacterium]|nr:shikimate dehydrogenase [Candidatus Sumerlaeota bacterium]